MNYFKILALVFILLGISNHTFSQTPPPPPGNVEIIIKKIKKADEVYFKNQLFYFSKGNWYKKHESGYKKIKAPIGATINSLPKDATELIKDAKVYYQYKSTYFIKEKKLYKVVAKP